MKKICIFLFLFVLSFELNAQNFNGSWGYRIDGNYVTVYGDKIQNQNTRGRTGTLKIALWATDYPYTGGNISGYNLFERKLEPLDASFYYYDVSKTGWCTYPPEGSYSLTILLLEYISYEYQIVDHVTMSGYTRF